MGQRDVVSTHRGMLLSLRAEGHSDTRYKSGELEGIVLGETSQSQKEKHRMRTQEAERGLPGAGEREDEECRGRAVVMGLDNVNELNVPEVNASK